MRVRHLNLTVDDVEATQQFMETYFQLQAGHKRKNFVVMYDDDGFVLTLMKGKNVQYPATFHLGFPQASREDVDQLYQQLKEAGYQVTPPKDAHGYTFYVQAPGGFTIEVVKWYS